MIDRFGKSMTSVPDLENVDIRKCEKEDSLVEKYLIVTWTSGCLLLAEYPSALRLQ